MPTYREYLTRLSTIPWMLAEWGAKWLGYFALETDTYELSTRDATKSRFIDTSADDALPYAGSDSNLERYAIETNDGYRDRLRKRWDTWPTAGTESGPSGFDGLLGQLAAFGLTNVEIFDAFDWPLRPPTPWWSQFWLVVHDPPFALQNGNRYDDPLVTYDGGKVYDAGVDLTIADALRRIVKKFKPAHTVCREIIFQVGPGHLYDDPTVTYDDPAITYDAGTVVSISGI